VPGDHPGGASLGGRRRTPADGGRLGDGPWVPHRLYRNPGNGTFRDETKERGLVSGSTRWGTGCSFFDYDRDGDLDLFIANYVDFDPARTPRPGEDSACTWKGQPVICGPMGLPAETMSLFRNEGKGRFADVSRESDVAGPREYHGLTVVTSDFDNDGWPDIYVACDSTASLLYRNLGDLTFSDATIAAELAVHVQFLG